MHVKSLKVFCDVVGRRSFSRAADDNGISQSGASQMVHHLEEHLGVKLIDRSKRPFVLTPEGEVYYDGCRRLVQKFYALEEEVRSLHQQVSGRVNVAAIYSVGLSDMQEFVQDFSARYPKATVHLEYHHPRRIYELVESDQVDVGLVSYPKSSRAIDTLPWREEPLVLVCAPQHPLALAAPVRLEQLSGHEMVGLDSGLIIRQKIDRLFSSHRVEVSVVMEFDNIETLKRAIEINEGFSLLPRHTVDREVKSGTLQTVAVTDLEMRRPVGIIHRRGIELGRTARRFIELLQQRASSSRSKSEHDGENQDVTRHDEGGAAEDGSSQAASSR